MFTANSSLLKLYNVVYINTNLPTVCKGSLHQVFASSQIRSGNTKVNFEDEKTCDKGIEASS
jgi:hypothetical protein